MTPNPRVVYLVVGTLALAVVFYAITLTLCALSAIEPTADVLTAFKDLAIFASGALAALLARTGTVPEKVAPTEVVAPAGQPLPVQESTPAAYPQYQEQV